MELKAIDLQTVGVLQESEDPLHVSKEVPSAGPHKETRGPASDQAADLPVHS